MKRFNNSITLCIYLLLIIISFVCTSCKKQETLVQKATKEKLLLIANGAEPTTLDPAFAMASNDHAIMRTLFEPLVILDADTLSPCPGMATDWEISSDKLTYTFHLRKNAHFSNGDPITAHDFVFTLKRLFSPHLGSIYPRYIKEIKNAKAYNERKINDFNEVGIKAIDDYTLQFNLDYPNPFFLYSMACEFVAPLHQKTLEKFNAIDTMNSKWSRPENIVSNGPFIMKEWRTNDYIEVEKNPYYWNADEVKLNKIRFLAITDRTAEERAFRAGQLHITSTLPRNQAYLYHQRKDPNLHSTDINGVYVYIFNTRIYPLNDVRVRKALAMSIKRSVLARDVFHDGRKPAYNFISPVNMGYRPSAFVQEDIDKAQELLAQAGFPNGSGFPELELVFNTDDTHLSVAQAVQQMWKKNLNITIKLVNIEWKTLVKKLHEHDFQIMRMAWISDTLDPLDVLRAFEKDSPEVPTGWFNPKYDGLIKKALYTADLPTRLEYFAQAESVLIDELPIIPISFSVSNWLVEPSVKGWKANFANVNYFQFIDLVPPKE